MKWALSGRAVSAGLRGRLCVGDLKAASLGRFYNVK